MSVKDERNLTAEEVLTFLLATERVAAAQTALSLRNEQREALLKDLTARYSEGDKYRIIGIDPDKRVIIRELVVAPIKESEVKVGA